MNILQTLGAVGNTLTDIKKKNDDADYQKKQRSLQERVDEYNAKLAEQRMRDMEDQDRIRKAGSIQPTLGVIGAPQSVQSVDPVTAEGVGLMNAQPAGAAQQNAPQPAQTQPGQAQQENPIQTQLRMLDERSKAYERQQAAAMQSGRLDEAAKYYKSAQADRGEFLRMASGEAMRRYQSGDQEDFTPLLALSGVVRDGTDFTGVKKNEDGTYEIGRRQFGKELPPIKAKSRDEILQLFNNYALDPERRTAREDKLFEAQAAYQKKRMESMASAEGKNQENFRLRPGEQQFNAQGQRIAGVAPLPQRVSGGAGSSGGGGSYSKTKEPGDGYLRFFKDDKTALDYVDKYLGGSDAIGLGGDAVQTRNAVLKNLDVIARSNPDTNLQDATLAAKALSVFQSGQQIEGAAKPELARDFRTGEMRMEMAVNGKRFALPLDPNAVSSASPETLLAQDEKWASWLNSQKPVAQKIESHLKNPQVQQMITQAMQDPAAREQFEQATGIPLDAYKVYATWNGLPFPDQTYAEQVKGIRILRERNKQGAQPRNQPAPAGGMRANPSPQSQRYSNAGIMQEQSEGPTLGMITASPQSRRYQ